MKINSLIFPRKIKRKQFLRDTTRIGKFIINKHNPYIEHYGKPLAINNALVRFI